MTSKSISTLHVLSSRDDSEEPYSEEESSSSDDCGKASVQGVSQNVLSGLNRAKPASISRTRALKLNPLGERKRKRCGPSTKLRRKRLHDCVAGFPGEYLAVECGVLFCEACRVEVSPKASSLKRHIRSNRHVSGKKQCLKEIEHQQSTVMSRGRNNA